MPSGASSERREAKRLASLTFFLDHQIGRYVVADALRSAGARVEVHLDHFPGDKPDAEWIPEIGRRGWVLITKDQNIRRNPLERRAYEAAKLRGFVVTGKDMMGTSDFLATQATGTLGNQEFAVSPLVGSQSGLERRALSTETDLRRHPKY